MSGTYLPLHEVVSATSGANGHSNYNARSQGTEILSPPARKDDSPSQADKFRLFTGFTWQSADEAEGKEIHGGSLDLEYLQDQLKQSRDELRRHATTQQALVDHATANPAALFILSKVVEADTLEMTVLTENLEPPEGWRAFALLWRAQLIDCYQDLVVPTVTGVQLMKWITSHRNSAQPESSRG